MNRVIKFRGRLKNSNEWKYGSLLTYADGECNIITETGHRIDTWNVDLETVGQFTGLLDSDKADIYEGDFLECVLRYDKDNEYTEYGCVVFELGEFVLRNAQGAVIDSLPFMFQNGNYPPIHHVKVIGNQFENPAQLIQISTNNEPQG